MAKCGSTTLPSATSRLDVNRAEAGRRIPIRSGMRRDSRRLGLPNCSSNRRSFCSVARPPRTIEIFSQEDQKNRRREMRVRAAACGHRVGFWPLKEYFWFWSSKNKNALSSLAFCPSDLPVKSRRLSTRAVSMAAARRARSARPGDGTTASASDLRLGSPAC
jgi:hypothetical protein